MYNEVFFTAAAHISDVHSRSWRLRPGVLKKGVDMVNALHPDLIAFTGDLITLVPEELDVTGPVLSALSAPDGVVSVLGKDYPLTLSGHTHAAQLSFLGWSPARVLFPRVRGLFREGGQYLYINVGIGETAFPARIGVRPEITLITLRRL